MSHSLRHPLAAALAACALFASASALAQPVKVQLPKDAPPKPREPPATVPPDAKKGPNRAALQSKGLFQLDFDKVEIEKLVQTMSDMTGKLFILPENIRGKISIIGPERGKTGVTAAEAYQAFLSALDANGLTIQTSGKFLRIVEKRSGRQGNIPTILEEGAPFTTNEQMVTKLVRLKYVEAEPIKGILTQLVSKDGDIISFPPDTLIINDIGLNLHRLLRILDQLDRPTSSDEMHIILLRYMTATDAAEKLKLFFDDKAKKPGQKSAGASMGEGGPASVSLMVPDERTNKLIVVANDAAMKRIDELLKQLDQPVAGEGQVHVYYLENANAEDLASTLSSLTQGLSKPAGTTGGGRRGAEGARPAGAAAAAGAGSPTVADLFSGEVKITAEKSTNSLVIIANGNDYRNLVAVIRQLDIARRQVFVEAVIMEVNLESDTHVGISMHGGDRTTIKSTDDSAVVLGSQTGTSSIGGVMSLATLNGFLAGIQGPPVTLSGVSIPSLALVLQALQKSSDVNVLSTPHILTSDNEEAEIAVGQNVPFLSSANVGLSGLSSLAGLTGTTGTSSLAGLGLGSLGGFGYGPQIQRQNVELKLKIKPQINESDYIRLEIDEQTEEIASTDPTLGPTTSKRSAKTTVVARDQQTVVIGGLIQERAVRSVTKTPILGDIPVLGWLFRDSTTKKTKTNLLLILTPYIIRDQADFRRIFERKMKERQEFVEQFYGRQPGVKIAIDYNRKAGPIAKALRAFDADAQRIENGGPGVDGEKVFQPGPMETAPAPQPTPEQPSAPAPQPTPEQPSAPAPEPAPEPTPAPDSNPQPIEIPPPPRIPPPTP